jgi:hypothetical protein
VLAGVADDALLVEQEDYARQCLEHVTRQLGIIFKVPPEVLTFPNVTDHYREGRRVEI